MGGAPVYPQNIQIPTFPQVPQNQYFNSIPNVSSWNGLLQQVMNNAGQDSIIHPRVRDTMQRDTPRSQ
ncbi:hypothetical protein SESBI_28019 [Sesbania bispinosa]|nr:hypothetical protein SESBI_28019 [Sesbania bispinosa]